jgi:MFS family permease
VLRDWPFYLLLMAGCCSIGAVGGMMQNLKLYMSLDLKFAQDQTAPVLSLVLASSLAGRLLVGWLADLWPKKYVMVLTYAIVAVAVVLLLFADSQASLYLFAVVFGIGLGGDYMIVPLMAAELFAESVLARVLGVLLTAGVAAEALAPMVVAAIRDRTGSYRNGLLILLLLAAVGTGAVAMVPKKRAVKVAAEAEVGE